MGRRGRPKIEIDLTLLASGKSALEIAELAGVSVDTALARQRDAGLPVRRQGQRGPACWKPLAGACDHLESSVPLPDWMRESLRLPDWMRESPRLPDWMLAP